MPEILLYGSIYNYGAEAFINAMNAAADEDVVIRINSDGGSPETGWGMVAKCAEHKGKVKIKVDGKAHSTAAYMLCYAEDVECLDVSQFLLHRAAYAYWIESNQDLMTKEMKDNLAFVNGKLRKALESKIDVAKFEELKGVTLNQIFSTDSRIDVMLSPSEAKKVGLVNRVVSITPQKKAEIESYMQIAAHGGTPEPVITTQPIITKMDITKLRAEHPALYAEVVALGVAQEKDRVEACLEFLEIDPAGAKAAIESGKQLGAKQIAAFALKAMSGKRIEAIVNEGSEEVKTDEAKKKETEAQAKVSDFEMQARKELIKPKN